MSSIAILEKIAKRLRIHSLQMTTAAGSGHPSTCLSCAEIMACLFFHEMRFNPGNSGAWENDEFVLSKGHAAPILWAAYAEAGIIPQDSLLDLRKIRSDLEGHPTPRMPWVKAASGSLGQGLSIGVGLALAQKLAGVKARTFVLLGDGECAEGAVWEAANAGREFKLGNLIAIVDVNRLGQSEPTMHEHNLKAYAKKFQAFGWEVYQVDGHKIEKIIEALARTRQGPKPKVILARTIKGKGVSFIEDKNGWHGKPLKPEDLGKALAELGPMPEVNAKKYVRSRQKVKGPKWKDRVEFELSSYKDKTATRLAYGLALEKLGRVNDRVVVIDGDVKNSTYTDKFFSAFPGRSFESFIAEQNMIGMAIGLAAKGFLPFAATFAAFLTRAHDQIRMAAYSFSNIKLCGSHVGVSIGEDGPSQMGLEDLAMFLPIPGCTVLYPSDGVSTEKCVQEAARQKGMVYIRTTRPATPILYAPEEEFPVGGSKVVKKSDHDAVTVIAAGITVHEALRAAEFLEKEGIRIRVIDAYSVKPLDGETIVKSARETGGRVVVAEDHFEQGGLGTAVALILPEKKLWKHLCIRELPRSGRPEELMAKYGIDAEAIAAAAKSLLT
ncbi:MAG TPA: transketolase [Candidatus Saccharicenans sp.]|jgi:transketolase|nr:transketolase [Candidatus Saccharicenans sp.]HRD02173.1 transketolase [Candidatus Saccharicenans sp.]